MSDDELAWSIGTPDEVQEADRADINYDRIVAVLVGKLESIDPSVARAAELDLLAVGNPASPVLIQALAEGGWAVRARVARVLADLGCVEAIPSLMSLCEEAQAHPAEASTHSHEMVASIDDLLTLPEQPRWARANEPEWFRVQVICALHTLRGPEGIAALCELLDDVQPEIQRLTALALRSLAELEPCSELRSALSPLRRIAGGWFTSDPRSRRECQRTIKAIEGGTAADQLPVPASPGELTDQSLPLAHSWPVEDPGSPTDPKRGT
jgi:HEAT repeat protein